MAFGCPPSRLTPAESTLASDFFQFLEDSADGNGYIALPGNLNFFKTKNKENETLVKVSQPALLRLSEEYIGGSGEAAGNMQSDKDQLLELIEELDDR